MTKEALTLLVHEMEYVLSCINENKIPFDGDDFHEALRLGKKALAHPEQKPNKDGSPCPEFWDWLPKAYDFDGNGAFTKYNMEVAFLAGKQAAQPEQEPWECVCGANLYIDANGVPRSKASVEPATVMFKPEQEPVALQMDVIVVNLVREGINKHRARELAEHFIKQTTPPQRTWVGLTDEEMTTLAKWFRAGDIDDFDMMEEIEAKLKEKNSL